jgi:hypothetical protein
MFGRIRAVAPHVRLPTDMVSADAAREPRKSRRFIIEKLLC